MQSLETKSKERIGLILGPLLFIVVILIPMPQSMAETAIANSLPPISPMIALATMVWMFVWWVSECAPLGLTSLLAPTVFVISGILSIRQALISFSDPIIWIFAAGFILAGAFQKWGLDKRVAYSLALIYKGSNPQIAVFFVACLPVFFLTVTGSITGATTIAFPFLAAFLKIVQSLNGSEDESKKNQMARFSEAGFLALGQAATAGAMLLLISTAPNLVAKATVERFVPGKTITFNDWFLAGSPHAVIGLIVSWATVFLIIRPNVKLPTIREHLLSSQRSLGRLSREEKLIISILFMALFLWIVPNLLRSIYPVQSNEFWSFLIGLFVKNITEAVPALLVILAVGLARAHKDTPLLTWNEMQSAIDWNVVLLLGGGLVLGQGLETSGLAKWVSSQIALALGSSATPWTIFAISSILGFAISYAASNTASAVISCPMAAALALGAGVNPIPPIIAAALASSISSALPSTTPPMAIIYSSRAVRILTMFKVGMTSDLLRLVLLILLGPILTGILYLP
jgi:sodium-dependent dicarboxylate transporter 2/3/5